MKALLDIIGSFIALVVLFPVLFITALLILIAEQKTPFFPQERIGKNKRPFTIYKFRTMLGGKITPIGLVLRRTGIDELPQLINILCGQMSFIGPRPLTASDISRLGWDTPFYSKRWSLRPGIVGLAQLAPVCHKKMSWFYDRYYCENQSLLLDFRILVAALFVPFVGKQKVKNWIHGK